MAVKESPPWPVVPPANGFNSIAGTYFHPAYGVLNLKPLASVAQQHHLHSADELDHSSSEIKTFVANVTKLWANQYIFTHWDGNLFNVSAKLNMPETGAFLWDSNGPGITAMFGEAGVGLQGLWGAGVESLDKDMAKHGIRNGSEVFFGKVGDDAVDGEAKL
jgi:hypothetical protein